MSDTQKSQTQAVVGMPKDEAVRALTESGYTVRIINLNGPPARLIENYDIGRATIEVRDGTVISVRIG